MRLGHCWFIRLIFLHQLSFFLLMNSQTRPWIALGFHDFKYIVNILLTYIFGQPYLVSTILWKWGWKLSTPETYSNNMQTIGKQLCPMNCSCEYRLDSTCSTPLLIFIDQWWWLSVAVTLFCSLFLQKRGSLCRSIFTHHVSWEVRV